MVIHSSMKMTHIHKHRRPGNLIFKYELLSMRGLSTLYVCVDNKGTSPHMNSPRNWNYYSTVFVFQFLFSRFGVGSWPNLNLTSKLNRGKRRSWINMEKKTQGICSSWIKMEKKTEGICSSISLMIVRRTRFNPLLLVMGMDLKFSHEFHLHPVN